MTTAPPEGLDVRDVRKKPLVIQAVAATTDNLDLIRDWIVDSGHHATRDTDMVVIQTLEGPFTVRAGDQVLRGGQGEFYRHEGGDYFQEMYDDLGPHTATA
jgi:hypothetical protein